MLKLHKIIRMPDLVACSIVFPLFDKGGLQGGVFKVIKNDHFLVFLAVWGLIPKYLGRLSLWLILGLREMTGVLNLVACSMDFNLLCD